MPPSCPLHSDQPITSLCLHPGCVLPLCPECLDSHRQQFPQGDHLSKNVPWSQARTIAIEAIQGQRKKLEEMQRQVQAKIEEFRVRASICLSRCLDEIAGSLRAGLVGVRQNIGKFEHSVAEIYENNVKQVINHFDYGDVFKCARYEISYQIQETALKQCMASFIRLKIVNMMEIRKDATAIKQPEATLQQAKQGQVQNKPLRIEDLKVESRASRSKPRLGIFVASSPNSKNRGFTSPSLQSKKLKQQYLNQSNQKPQSNLTPSRKKQHKSIFKSTVQLGYSPFFSHEKPVQGSTPLKVDLSSSRNSHIKSQKNIKTVINRNDLASGSTSRLVIKRKQNTHNDLLTPQQMKQLIMRRRPLQPRPDLQEQTPNYYSKMLSDKLGLVPK